MKRCAACEERARKMKAWADAMAAWIVNPVGPIPSPIEYMKDRPNTLDTQTTRS